MDAPALLLLHDFSTSSHMFLDLTPKLADRYRGASPDLAGFADARLSFQLARMVVIVCYLKACTIRS